MKALTSTHRFVRLIIKRLTNESIKWGRTSRAGEIEAACKEWSELGDELYQTVSYRGIYVTLVPVAHYY